VVGGAGVGRGGGGVGGGGGADAGQVKELKERLEAEQREKERLAKVVEQVYF